MKRGEILAAVRRENKTSIVSALVITAILAAVLALNWRYLYNWAFGPFPFDPALATAPGAREFVRAEGPMLPTGLVEETTFRLFRGAIETKSRSASYMAMLTSGGILVVKVPADYAGRVVEGRLVPLPQGVRAELEGKGAGEGGARRAFHPFLLEQRGYGWLDSNIFVLVGLPLFLLMLPILAWVTWKTARIERHDSMQRLARLGPLNAVVARVESAIAAAGRSAKAGPLWITREWIVGLSPTVLVFSASDLVGVGVATATSRSAGRAETKHTLQFWARGERVVHTLDVTASESVAALAAVARAMPWAVVEDAGVFDERWTRDRAQCTRDADERRQALAAGAGSPPVAR
jgi:hypothetical protein